MLQYLRARHGLVPCGTPRFTPQYTCTHSTLFTLHPLFALPLPPWVAALQDMQRPLYMQPADALAYNIIDGVVTPEKQIIDDVKSADQWDKEAGLVAR